MKLGIQLLMAALLAGVASAQTVPASQAVAPSTPPASNNKAPSTSVKAPASNAKPAAPGAKPASNAQSATKTPQGSAKNPTAQQKSPFAPKPNAPATANAATKAKPQTPGKPQVAAKQPVPAPAKNQPAKTQAPAVQAKQAEKPAEKSAPAPEKKAEATPAPVAQAAPAKLPSPGKRDPFLSPLAAAAMKVSQNCTSADRKRCLVVDQIVLKGVVQMKSGNIALVENPARRPYYLRENDSLFNGSVVKITGDSVIFREEGNDILGRPVSKEVVKKVSAPAV